MARMSQKQASLTSFPLFTSPPSPRLSFPEVTNQMLAFCPGTVTSKRDCGLIRDDSFIIGAQNTDTNDPSTQ
uniref:Uncharacterized protein n=1 Tax=Hyaloperonospora arabidopsidis (strain Emoy2) TaxID=559515 RepID=M4BJ09_HYAAE